MSGKSIALDDEQLVCLEECLLIHYKFHPGSGAFVVVADHWEKQEAGCRAFIRIRFSGVEAFEREPGIHRASWEFVEQYRLRAFAPPKVFQLVKTVPLGEGRTRVELWFGPAFGGVSFTCREYSAWLRVTRARQQGSEWEYRDATTGDLVDFFDPFGEWTKTSGAASFRNLIH
ncbi:hypothetical protein HPC49_36815 [Pyxidicoccus fallax]|uniref:Uncharacterized protein n=1 Tax=Pyxidicoccus fallax TaxID=394095 RepID=A0A848LRS3_9BACT|nr:hypothetical protein [Pyxidicoccus fallax]NMO20369.1 hypothetical protein [Pyxidicoccus fallax]NPC83769.1 hypothetical protein [Pyxidicoccus fallax]